MVRTALCVCLVFLSAPVFAAEQYNGPRPPKPDIPYILHADTLIPTEVTQASEATRKKDTVYTIPGASSPAKTPVPEPIFIMEAKSIQPSDLGLYRMDVHDGNREVAITGRHSHNDKVFHLTVTKLGENLYRIEVEDTLANGEYSLSPSGSNIAFCFEEY